MTMKLLPLGVQEFSRVRGHHGGLLRNVIRPRPLPSPRALPLLSAAPPTTAGFTSTPSCLKTKYPPRPKPPPDEEITEAYLKGSGPGGQKINKTNSAVQLKHIPTGIVVKCQETRSREQNRKLAREHLAEKIDDFLNGENSRSAVVARILARKKASALKKSRRKHRQAAEGNTGEKEEEEDHNDDEEAQNPR